MKNIFSQRLGINNTRWLNRL